MQRFGPEVGVELADRLEERQRLDVADGAADLGDHEVDRLGLGDDQDPFLISSVMWGITWTVAPR